MLTLKIFLILTYFAFVKCQQKAIPIQALGPQGGPQEKPCNTKQCQIEAERMKSRMDVNVKPCDNFYQFACGKFQPKIPDDKTEVDDFTTLEDGLRDKLLEIMDEKSKPTDSFAARLIKTFYQSCMNTAEITKKGLRPMEDFIKELKGWPLLERTGWNQKSWTLQQSMQVLDFIGSPSNFLFEFIIKQDPKNNEKWIDQPYLEVDMFGPFAARYKLLQIEVVQMFGVSYQNAREEMGNVFNFEKDLANILQSEDERRDVLKTFNKITIRDFQRIFRSINWVNYLKRLMPQFSNIMENTEIFISSREFFSDLEKLLNNTPKKTIANYLIWRLIYASLDYLTPEMKTKKFLFESSITGEKKDEARWKDCVDLTAQQLNHATSAIYARKFIILGTRNDTLDMVKDIQMRFQKVLENCEWMDDETKVIALQKLANMYFFIGFPDELKNDEVLAQFYSGLKIDEKEFFKTVFKTNHYAFRKELLKYKKDVNRVGWESHSNAVEVNAYYSFNENAISLPAVVLQTPFFGKDRILYLNYACLGFIAGHEITHGFDTQGREFDEDGNMIGWWSKQTNEQYLNRIQCILEQYNNYTEPNVRLKVDGKLTLNENIADNAGIRLAYDAYAEWSKNHETELPLPGLKYTPSQFFWIAAAQMWCQNQRPEKIRYNIANDYHAPRQFRVNGPFSNSPNFAEDWKCPFGSRMNPIKKCRVWFPQ